MYSICGDDRDGNNFLFQFRRHPLTRHLSVAALLASYIVLFAFCTTFTAETEFDKNIILDFTNKFKHILYYRNGIH